MTSVIPVVHELFELKRLGVTDIIEYARRGDNGRKRGMVVAQYDHTSRQYRIGWSGCAESKGDVFDLGVARSIAVGRCLARSYVNANAVNVDEFIDFWKIVTPANGIRMAALRVFERIQKLDRSHDRNDPDNPTGYVRRNYGSNDSEIGLANDDHGAAEDTTFEETSINDSFRFSEYSGNAVRSDSYRLA